MDNKENGSGIDGAEKKPRRRPDFKKILLPLLMVTLATLLIIAAVIFRDEGDGRRSRTVYGYFDTVSVIYDYSGDSKKDFNERCLIAEDTLRFYHGLFDIYNDAEGVIGLYEINGKAGVEPVEVCSELIDFLEFSKEAHALTHGEVNIAMGAVTSLWHDCRAMASTDPANARVPDPEALGEAALHCDIEKLVIDKENSTVFLADGNMRLDPGAIGKGYATERAAERLREAGALGYVLDIGGNIRAVGSKPSGDSFTTGIKDPSGGGGYADVVEISDSSAVTSGGYERYYYVGDKRYHHIIDKDTLTSPDTFASVTVLTYDSGLADALSTALFCMSYEEGLSLVETLDGVNVIWVYHDGTVVRSGLITDNDNK